MTYTYAVLDVSPAVYEEVKELLFTAGYQHAFREGDERGPVIDMHGIALRANPKKAEKVPWPYASWAQKERFEKDAPPIAPEERAEIEADIVDWPPLQRQRVRALLDSRCAKPEPAEEGVAMSTTAGRALKAYVFNEEPSPHSEDIHRREKPSIRKLLVDKPLCAKHGGKLKRGPLPPALPCTAGCANETCYRSMA